MSAVEQIEARVGTQLGVAEKVIAEVGKVIVGQREMIEGLLWGLLAVKCNFEVPSGETPEVVARVNTLELGFAANYRNVEGR